MIQIVIVLVAFFLLVLPMGKYLYHIIDKEKTFADPLCNPIDNFIFRLCRIDRHGMNWKEYAFNLVLTNGVMIFAGYLILRIQSFLPLNPNGIPNMEATLSFNTIISFMTNTNLQHYAGESGLSYLSQILVITFLMFTSAASGYAAFAAFTRGICGKESLGNFYEDFVRIITRVFLPLALLVGLFLVSQGSPQNFSMTQTLTTLEGKLQDVANGPIASLVSIKHLGTNGGGFLGANSSTPFENPNVLTNMVEMLSMMLVPGSAVVAFGLFFQNQRQKRLLAQGSKVQLKNRWLGGEGRTLFIAMAVLFLVGLSVCFWAESAGNPALTSLGIDSSMGSMEGKEVRFGIAQSSLFTTVTTAFTTGSVNNMHDTLTPMGGFVALLNMMLNVVFGGVGVGFMNMMMYVILAVFICGLMIGRTPEYLGKKIESREMKLTVLAIIIHPLLILGFSALAVTQPAGVSALSNPGFHGLSQILYEFTSAAANNGSGFEGLKDNTTFWNITTGLVMFFGRYLSIVIQLAIAASLMKKRVVNESPGTLKTNTVFFGMILAAIVVIFAALTFFPVLSLGPIAEQLTLG